MKSYFYNIFIKVLGRILFFANCNPGSLACKSYFYPVKNKILKRFGKVVCTDIQYIYKKCDRCSNGRYIELWGYNRTLIKNVTCFYCNGTAVYQEYSTFLDKYKIGNYYFHNPVKKVNGDFRHLTDEKGQTFEGYIKHKIINKKLSIEAILWLFLLFDRRTLKYFYNSLNLYSHYFKKSFYPLSFIFWIVGIFHSFKNFLKSWFDLANTINDDCPDEFQPQKVGYLLGLELSLGIWYDFYPQNMFYKVKNKFKKQKLQGEICIYEDIPPF